MLSRPARPIRTLHLEDLVLLVAKCVSGFTHFVIEALYALDAVDHIRSISGKGASPPQTPPSTDRPLSLLVGLTVCS